MSQASQSSTATHSLDQLLRLGADAARSGNRQAARALFVALAREHPGDARVWMGLAGVAASRNEQREALERVVALDPANQRARLALERLTAAAEPPATGDAAGAPQAPITPAAEQSQALVVSPAPAPEAERQPTPFPLLNAIAMALILLLLAAVGVILGRALLGDTGTAVAPTLTPALILEPAPGGQAGPGAATTAPAPGGQAGAGLEATAVPVPEEQPGGVAAATAAAAPPTGTAPPGPAAPTAPAATTAPGQAATAAPEAGQSLTLPMGTPIDHDGWTAVLVRPDYVLPLDGAIGDLRPSGSFVLAVVAVSNNSPSPRVIPPDLFLLVDSAGRTYAPVPGASTAYLTLYERAQRGDLALEDTFEPVIGLRSVPLIFDVPVGVTGLRLTVNGAGPAGWPVGETAAPAAPSGP